MIGLIMILGLINLMINIYRISPTVKTNRQLHEERNDE